VAWRDCFAEHLTELEVNGEKFNFAEMRLVWPDEHDFNCDYKFSVSDLFDGAGWLFHLPGDLVLSIIMGNSDWRKFFELDVGSFGNAFSTAISIVAWFIAWIVVSALLDRETWR
jgi:hypothetical protein